MVESIELSLEMFKKIRKLSYRFEKEAVTRLFMHRLLTIITIPN